MIPHRDYEWAVLLALCDLGSATEGELFHHVVEHDAPIDRRLLGAVLRSFESSGLIECDEAAAYRLATPLEEVVRQAAEHLRQQLGGRPELLAAAVRALEER